MIFLGETNTRYVSFKKYSWCTSLFNFFLF